MRGIKELPYHLDVVGNKVVEGQMVVTNTKEYAHLSVGVVKKVTAKGIRVSYESGITKMCYPGQFVLVAMKDNKNIYR